MLSIPAQLRPPSASAGFHRICPFPFCLGTGDVEKEETILWKTYSTLSRDKQHGLLASPWRISLQTLGTDEVPQSEWEKRQFVPGWILANGKQEEEETWLSPFSTLSHEFAFWLFWKLRMPKPCVDCQAPPCLRGKWSPRSHLPEFSTSCPFLSLSKGSFYQVSPQLTLVF